MPDTTLQQSHDELAKSLVTIADQLVRGSHLPTPAQLLEAADALRKAAPHIQPDAWGVNPRYASGMADVITEKYGLETASAPGPRLSRRG